MGISFSKNRRNKNKRPKVQAPLSPSPQQDPNLTQGNVVQYVDTTSNTLVTQQHDFAVFCATARTAINALESFTTREISRVQVNVNGMQRALQQAASECTDTKRALDRARDEHQGFTRKAQLIRYDIQSLEQEIAELVAENHRLEAHIAHHEQTRLDGICGLFDSSYRERRAREEGDPMMLNPGYLALKGIDSAFNGKVTEARKCLAWKRAEATREIPEKRASIQNYEMSMQQILNSINQLQREEQKHLTQMAQIDATMKATGQHLTRLQNVRAKLAAMMTKYNDLFDTVRALRDIKEVELAVDFVREFRELRGDCRSICA